MTQRNKSREKSKEFLHVIILPQKIHERHVPLRQRYCFTHAALPIKSKSGGYGVSGSREVPPMELSRVIARFARSRPVIECAQCGERIYIPEWSECLDGCRVRHLWQCDACGTSFETTVRIEAAA